MICLKTYHTKHKGTLNVHLWRVHDIGNGQIFKCSDCEFSTKIKTSFVRHKWMVHNIGNGKIFKCTEKDCDFSAKQKYNVTQHLQGGDTPHGPSGGAIWEIMSS